MCQLHFTRIITFWPRAGHHDLTPLKSLGKRLPCILRISNRHSQPRTSTSPKRALRTTPPKSSRQRRNVAAHTHRRPWFGPAAIPGQAARDGPAAPGAVCRNTRPHGNAVQPIGHSRRGAARDGGRYRASMCIGQHRSAACLEYATPRFADSAIVAFSICLMAPCSVTGRSAGWNTAGWNTALRVGTS